MSTELNPNADVRLSGYWWLPGSAVTDRVPGVLTFSPGGGGELELIGGFERSFVAHLRGYPRVLGEVEHQYVTLLDCWTSSRRARMGSSAPREVVGVSRGVVGILFDDVDEIVQFDRCRVHLRHLTQWSRLNGLSLDSDSYWQGPGDPETVRAVAKAEWLDLNQCVVAEGWDLELSQRLRPFQRMNLEVGITQEVVVKLSAPALVRFDSFVDLISDLQDLVTIATGRPAQIQDLLFEHPQARVQFASGDVHPTARDELRYFARWNAVDPDLSELNWQLLFFSFEDLGGMTGIQRWMRVAAEYRTELGRVMGLKYRTGVTFEDRVVNLTAALESLDRRRRPDKVKDLQVRLKRLVRFCGATFSPGILRPEELSGWSQAVIHHRDNAAHHRGRQTQHTSSQRHFLSESLYWLFVLSMLRLAGAREEALERILQHSDIHRLREGLKATFPATEDSEASIAIPGDVDGEG